MATNNNAELKDIEANVPSRKQEGPPIMEPQTVNEPVRSDFLGSSLHRDADAADGKDKNRCVISLTGSGLPYTHHCSFDDSVTRVAVEELTVGNYRNPHLVLESGTSSSKVGKCERLYSLASGPGFKALDGDSDSQPQDMDQMLLKIRQQLARNPPERTNVELFASKRSDQSPGAASALFRAASNKNILSPPAFAGAGLKTTPTSSFSQLILKRTLKGKGIVNRIQEDRSELVGGNRGCKDGRVDNISWVSSDALLKSSSKNDLLISRGVGRSSSKSSHGGMSLREWLSPGNSKRDKVQSLLLFRQIVELVDSAHYQGSVLLDMRPSCFMLSSSHQVLYTGSFGKNELKSGVYRDLNKKRPFERELSANFRGLKLQKLVEGTQSVANKYQLASSWRTQSRTIKEMDLNRIDSQDSDCTGPQSQTHFSYPGTSFITRKLSTSTIIQLEEQWYACPEELHGKDCRLKANIYGLGVLLFELLCSCESSEVHCSMMSDLRHRILPPRFFSENLKEAGFCLWLLHPDPSSRPAAREILQSELMYEDDSSLFSAADDEESELLLHFLSSLEEQKQAHASKLFQDIHSLEEDIMEAERRYSLRTSLTNFHDSNRQLCPEDASSLASRTLFLSKEKEDRLMKNIRQLEDAYFFMRSHLNIKDSTAAAACSNKNLLMDHDKWSEVQTENKYLRMKEKPADKLEVFFEGLCKFARYSKFEACGTIRSGDLLNSANVVCSLSFDRDEEHIAAAGISKRIKIFDFGTFMNDSVSVHYPLVEMVNKSKFSCVCWNSYIKNYLASTDYDGVAQIWDAGTGQGFSQYAEHQKRAWSVDFSPSDPTKFVSGSDDCSVKLWSINEKRSIGSIWSPANVCCVQFSASSSHLLTFGSADYKVYCYDLRHARIPWCTLDGHEKTVSYVKFLDSETLVSASTDNSLKLWNLSKTCSSGLSSGACTLTFRGHTNQKNFVGLSVLDGYIACGSETNEVCSYYRSLPMPITCYKFGSVDPISGHEFDDNNGQFVSSVCWRRKSNMLVAANSTGSMKLLKLI